MSTTADRKFVELLTAVDPFLNPETRKSCQAIKGMVDMFPGLSLTDVSKQLAKYVANAKKSVPALLERAEKIIDRSSTESVETWVEDVAKLGPADLKKLGKELDFDLSPDKEETVASLRKWLESRGTVKPPDGKERDERLARQLAGDLPQRMADVDRRVAEEVVHKAEAAAKDKKVGRDAFEAFGRLLGAPVSGSKPTMLKQIKNFVNRLALSHSQTQF